jgi:hypothetical protein
VFSKEWPKVNCEPTLDTKIKPELRPKLLDQWENTEKQSELWRDCMLEIYHLFYTLKFKAVKYKFSLPKCWGHNYKFKGYDEKILVPGSKDTSSQVAFTH